MRKHDDSYEKQATLRVISLRLDAGPKKSFLDYASPEESRGMRICKDEHGRLYLIRQSPDGWVTAYFLCDNSGPLFITPKKAARPGKRRAA
jgi:hypothetical protein